MQKFRIGLVGLGSVGAWVYSFLAENPEGAEVIILAEGDRKERLSREGIKINGKPYPLQVKDFAKEGQEQDLDFILLATKMNNYPEILEKIVPWVGEKTQIVPLQNGISSERLAAEKFGWDHVIYAVAQIAAEKEGQEATFQGKGQIIIGEEQKSPLAPNRVADLEGVLTASGMQIKVSDAALREAWLKFLLNCMNNQFLAILDVQYPALAKSKELLELTGDLGREVVKQDIRAKRPTEVDIFAGECVRLGEKHGIPTPLSLMIYRMIRVLEQKNAGLF